MARGDVSTWLAGSYAGSQSIAAYWPISMSAWSNSIFGTGLPSNPSSLATEPR
jgi:hypothetical protein